MSDPASNTEIEDVLSSIRRLVSDEPQARPKSEAQPDDKVERLVLTPAFRVPDLEDGPVSDEHSEHASGAEDEQEPEGAQEDHAEHAEQEVPASEDIEDAAEPVLAEHQENDDAPDPVLLADPLHSDAGAEPVAEDTAQPADDEAAPEEGLAAYEATQEWSDAKLAHSPAEPTADLDETDTQEPANEPNPESTADLSDPVDMSLEARIAELETAIQQTTQDWEPDGSEDGSDDETRSLSEDLDLLAEDGAPGDEAAGDADVTAIEDVLNIVLPEAPEDSNSEAAAEAEAPDMAAEEHEDGDASEHDMHEDLGTPKPLVEEDEAPEVTAAVEPVFEVPEDHSDDTVAETVAMWAEDASDDHAHAVDLEDTGTDPAPQDESVEAQADAPDHELHDDAAPESAEIDADDENLLADDFATIDEDALRDVVSEIVREELQGVLGERITRNVRRLVRREIQRAMAVRDLEP
ncbi:hypothetical protein AIOL_003416 [Candidatus Rhodobacter oscarellae]|uniref:Uncharacterized protein n=1 Tax=Candidatus Rhodobacter oscarellae TaxID=1675527 RepID=A0A0J9E6X1_9RHOB|nr:hypothetical protein [Candidatus Rhodobacter lobularis]KMW58442.1 hypothetical protein AIOL_003416 [Candidatus Rhodobacter lobularis]